MSLSVAIRQRGGCAAPFGLRADLRALDTVLITLDHGHVGDRRLDAEIYAALGWDVDCGPRARLDDGAAVARRRLGWRCRSPLAAGWEVLPQPTLDVGAAARLVPWRWSWWCGVMDGLPRAWCREDVARAGRMPRYAETQRLTVALSLTVAALHAHRQIILQEMGHE